MRKKKLIVHEKHTGKRSAEEVFAAVILAGKHESLTKTVKKWYNITNQTTSGFTLFRERRR